MDKNQSIQNLLNNTASEAEIQLFKRLPASGEISIGSGNTVELPPAALGRLGARPMLGNLDCDLTGEEIAAGLRRLDNCCRIARRSCFRITKNSSEFFFGSRRGEGGVGSRQARPGKLPDEGYVEG